MGVVEDIRQVIQDLVAPQLKSLDARVTALEISVNQRFTSAEAVANARHEALTAQIAQLANVVSTNHAAVLQKLDLEKRIERIELLQGSRFELSSAVGSQQSALKP